MYYLIGMPELDSALLTTHSAMESAKVCYMYAVPRLKDSAPTCTGGPESHFGRPAMESRITAAQEHSVSVNTKKSIH